LKFQQHNSSFSQRRAGLGSGFIVPSHVSTILLLSANQAGHRLGPAKTKVFAICFVH